jgi:hypothetical protein
MLVFGERGRIGGGLATRDHRLSPFDHPARLI